MHGLTSSVKRPKPDATADFCYYRARYYDAAAGRFIGEDPGRFLMGIDFYQYVGNDPTQWTDPSGLQKCKNKKSCGIKKAPEYGASGSVPPGTWIAWGAEFLNDSTHDPTCCEVRQDISWNKAPAPNQPAPHKGFQPPDNQPGQWYEDRTEKDRRYGHRTGPYAYPNPTMNSYHGNGYDGADIPGEGYGGGAAAGFTLSFRLRVVDVCNGGMTIYTSKTLQVPF